MLQVVKQADEEKNRNVYEMNTKIKKTLIITGVGIAAYAALAAAVRFWSWTKEKYKVDAIF